MRFLRKFLADTADLLMDLLRLVGLGGPRWEFRKQALRRRLLGISAGLENVRRSVRAEHKMCRECRALIPTAARRCPECGASTRGVPRGGLGRVVALLFPGFASVTILLVTLNFAVYLLSIVLAPGQARPDVLGVPGPSGYALWMLGGKFGVVMLPGDLSGYNQLYRLVTANLLHGNLIHIFFNTYALMNLGPLVEHLAGRRRFLVIYLATGVSGFLLSSLLSPLSLSVGASAAIYGLLGFLVVFGWRQGGSAGRALSAHLFRWVVIGVFLSLVPGIDLHAHLGGLVAGALFGVFFPWGEPRTVLGDRLLNLVLILVLLVTVLSLAGLVWDWGRNQALWPNIEEFLRTGSSSLPRVAPPR